MKFCPKCQEEKPLSSFYNRRGSQTHSYCKQCVNNQTKERQRALKLQAVMYKGGKCFNCDGVFHPASYDFHHPTAKDYSIGSKKNLKFEAHKEELDKCILLCSNCHRAHHAKYDSPYTTDHGY